MATNAKNINDERTDLVLNKMIKHQKIDRNKTIEARKKYLAKPENR